jgi:hypothetical protein
MRLVLLLSLSSLACFPTSRVYSPPSDYLRDLKGRTDVFPDDVRKDPAKFSGQVMLWTGIVLSKTAVKQDQRDVVEILFEHHYWDFVEDFGVQIPRDFLSPRGEGKFAVRVYAEELAQSSVQFQQGWMAIAWVVPFGVREDGTVKTKMRGASCVSPARFSTEMWDYGRAYLLQHDRSDLHILRTF